MKPDIFEDLVYLTIFMCIMMPLAIFFEAEIWDAMTWIMDVTENFNGRH